MSSANSITSQDSLYADMQAGFEAAEAQLGSAINKYKTAAKDGDQALMFEAQMDAQKAVNAMSAGSSFIQALGRLLQQIASAIGRS